VTLYNKTRWRRIREAQLQREPLCRMCAQEGRITPATVADHIEPHRGDMVAFWRGSLQSLCVGHHNAAKQRSEKRDYDNAIGPDGWPLDPRHPVYRAAGAPSSST
jgi:5-methylcytosine-specific restriction endonuclease McrA